MALNLRFPAFITLGLSVTHCKRCTGEPLIFAAVIHGLERRLDPLALSIEGLQAAVALARYVAVVSPYNPIAHRAKPGHWWLAPPGGGPPTLLAEHVHDHPHLAHDADLSARLLARFLPAAAQAAHYRPADAPPPF